MRFDVNPTQPYWLMNAHIPVCLLPSRSWPQPTREGLILVNLQINQGRITQLQATSEGIPTSGSGVIDLQKRLIFPGFVDCHTHLDKGHIWERSPNVLGTFDAALAAVRNDVERYYRAEDVYRRWEFGLKCSYVHGTTAIRTHVDAFGRQGDIGFEVFQSLQKAWRDRITLQAVCLVSIDYYQTSAGLVLVDKMAELGTVLGGVAYESPDLPAQLQQLFSVAQDRGLDLDLHVDETGDRRSQVLHQVAKMALERQFTGRILCGHCCSLGVQSLKQVKETLGLVKAAGIGIISLPMCNLYLQGRHQHHIPAWRGLTRIHQIHDQGIPLAFASDNCRDPFFGFGDHDGLEVFTQAVRIGHLDTPYEDWCRTVTQTPADLMGLSHLGRVRESLPADLIIFSARYFSELLSRPQGDRLVLRQGIKIDTTLPDYAELDDLIWPQVTLGIS